MMKQIRHVLLTTVITVMVIGQFAMPKNILAAPDSFAPMIKSEKEKVVHIATTTLNTRPKQWDSFFNRFFPNMPQERKSNALGSGFFLSEDGYIVTNNHVIENADKIQVITLNGDTYDAIVVGTDKKTDLALIKIEGEDFSPVTIGDSSAVEIGDWVVAIGNPLGLDFTVTAGILSARERSIFSDTAYGQFLQTDAAINPGNSGGPLFNADGEIIGINTAISAAGQGLGFAIPMNLATNIIDQLKKNGKVERGWLGVSIQEITNEMTDNLSLPPGTKGVIITSIGKGTPAEKSDLKEGDVFVEFNKKKIQKTGSLQQVVAETIPNSTVPVKIYRDGKLVTISVKMGLAPENSSAGSSAGNPNFILGMSLKYLNKEEAGKQGYNFSGLIVLDVDPNSEAAEKGIQKGDNIRQINRKNFNSYQDFLEVLRKTKKENILLLIHRPNSGNRFVSLTNN